MDTFYLTFGSQYPRNTHPRWEGASGDGWVEIVAPNYGRAREIAHGRFGPAWSMLYMPDEWDGADSARWYPLGCIGTIRQKFDGIEEDLRQPVEGVYLRATTHLVTPGAAFVLPVASVCGVTLEPRIGGFTLLTEEVTCSPCTMTEQFREAQQGWQ